MDVLSNEVFIKALVSSGRTVSLLVEWMFSMRYGLGLCLKCVGFDLV